MLKKWSVVSIVLILALLLGNTSPVFADSTIDTGNNSLVETSPYEYNTAPDGLYVFLYHGHAPYLNMDIDTSECIADRLYVYSSADNTVLEICDVNVLLYTATKDALYYSTSACEIVKTDYTGRDQQVLYQHQGKEISRFSCYWDNLYFVEDNCNVIFLNTSTGTAETVFACEDLDWVFPLSSTELLTVTLNGEHLIYDLTTREITEISEVEANFRMNQAVLCYADSQGADVSLMAVYDATDVTQQNDISFPLAEYPANIYPSTTASNYTYLKPLSWFHVNGEEGCSSTNCKLYTRTGECEGFARYAHDAYMHILDTNNEVSYSAWLTSKHPASRYNFDGNQDTIKAFYSTLNTGAYIRYGNNSDTTPSNGMHSVVFVSADDYGIWVYECNQSYYSNLTSDEIAGRDESDFGCGVFFQYITYASIVNRYHYVLHYVNHTFSNTDVLDNVTYHTVGCTNCDGYLRQAHDGTVKYTAINATSHRIRATCCSGHIDVIHLFKNNLCIACGYTTDTPPSIVTSVKSDP